MVDLDSDPRAALYWVTWKWLSLSRPCFFTSLNEINIIAVITSAVLQVLYHACSVWHRADVQCISQYYLCYSVLTLNMPSLLNLVKVYEEFLSLSQSHQNKEIKLLTSACQLNPSQVNLLQRYEDSRAFLHRVFIHSLRVARDPFLRASNMRWGSTRPFNELLFEANVTGLEVWLFRVCL